MRFTLNDQMVCFLFAVLTGLVIGIAYEVFRLIGVVIFTGKVSAFVCDFLFSAFFTFATVFFSMGFSRGYTRYFIVFGEFCSFLLFHFTIGRIFCKFMCFLVVRLKNVFIKIQIKSKKYGKKVLQAIHNILYNKCIKGRLFHFIQK